MTCLRSRIALAFIAGLVAQSARAQAIFNVTSDLDDGSAGSLPAQITAANGVAGSTVAWTTAGGTIDLTPSDLPSINGNTTLDVTAATGPVTLSGGSATAIPLGGKVNFFNNSSSLWTISSSISGAGELVKTGTGKLSLSGVNSYSGGTEIDAGILTISSGTAIPSGTITFNGGTLQAGTTVALSNPINLTGNGTLDAAGNPFAISGNITGSSGTVASPITLNFANTGVAIGTFTVTGNNSAFLGGMSLNGGIVNINSASALNAVTSTVTFNGGTLQAGASGMSLSNYFLLNNSNSAFDTNNQTTTFSGVINGGGPLNIISTGTVILGNAATVNNYTGNTFITNGALVVISTDSALGNGGAVEMNLGTLQIAGPGVTSARTFVMNANGGGTIDTQANNVLYSGVFEGGGSLTKVGTGTLFLTGSNSYSGGTFLNAGTINIINGAGLGSGVLTMNQGTVQMNGNFTVSNPITLNATCTGTIGACDFDTFGSTTTFAGVITGAGALSVISTGTIRLANSNTYSGGTFLNNSLGILNVESDAALGSSTATVTFNGGTLQLGLPTMGAIFTSARNMTLGAAGGTFDTNTFNAVLSGVIGGTAGGGFTKTGSGILTLSGLNTYNGPTTVAMDTLELGANGALPSATALTVNTGATFDMGVNPTTSASFSQTIGSLAQTGALKMTFAQSGQPAPLTAGSATIGAGSTLVVGLAPSILANGNIAGQTFNAIQTGSLTGIYTSTQVVSPAAVSFAPTYNGTNLVLTAALVPFANVPGISANQAAVGSAFEPLRATPTGGMATILGNLYTLDAVGLGRALDQLGPGSLGAMSGVGMAGSSVESAAVGQRMTALARGNGSGIASYQVSKPSQYPGTLIASASDDVAGLLAESGGVGSPWGFFASPVVTNGRLLQSESASGTQPGYAFNSGGLTGGGDYRFNDHFAAGAALGYLHGHASIYAPASGTVDNNSLRFGVYGTGFTENARANLYVGGAHDTFSTNRGIIFGQVNLTAHGAPTGDEFNLDSSAAYDYHTHDWGTFSPFAGLAYDRMMIGAFSETGADPVNLNVSAQTAQSMRSSLGLRYSEKFDMGDWNITPYGSLGWRHEFLNQSHPIEAQLASGAGTVFTVDSGGYARNGTLLGAGALANFTDNWSGKADYQGDFRARFMDNTFTATLRYKF